MRLVSTALVATGNAGQREAAIAASLAALPAGLRSALILEGMPDPNSPLLNAADAVDAVDYSVARIAPGCPCCIGNLTMRVTLNRILRNPPQHLFISLASPAHLEQVRAFLQSAPYDAYLQLLPDLLTA
jgi:hypothetical protein